mgnify:CR=1 FL=1
MKKLKEAAWFILGALLGAVAVAGWTGKQMDALYLQKTQLEQEIATLQEELASLTSRLENGEKKQLIEKLQFTVEGAPDGFSETEIVRRLQEIGKYFIGKEVRAMGENPEMLFYFFDDRMLYINDRWLNIDTKAVSISHVTHVWLEVKIQPDPSGSE